MSSGQPLNGSQQRQPVAAIQLNNPFYPFSPHPPPTAASASSASQADRAGDKMQPPSPSEDFPFGNHRGQPPGSADSSRLADSNPFAHHATLLFNTPAAETQQEQDRDKSQDTHTRGPIQGIHDFPSQLPASTDPNFFKAPQQQQRRPPSSSGSSAYPNPFSRHLNLIGEGQEQDEEEEDERHAPHGGGGWNHAAVSPAAGWQQASSHPAWQLTPEAMGSPWQRDEAASPPTHSGWTSTDAAAAGLGVSAAGAGAGQWTDFSQVDSPALGEAGPSNWHQPPPPPAAGGAQHLSNGFSSSASYSFGGHTAALHRPATGHSGHYQADSWRSWQPRPGTAKPQTPKYKPQTPKLAVKVARYIATPLGDDAPDLALNPYGRTAEADQQWNEENAAEVDSDDEDLERFAWNPPESTAIPDTWWNSHYKPRFGPQHFAHGAEVIDNSGSPDPDPILSMKQLRSPNLSNALRAVGGEESSSSRFASPLMSEPQTDSPTVMESPITPRHEEELRDDHGAPYKYATMTNGPAPGPIAEGTHRPSDISSNRRKAGPAVKPPTKPRGLVVYWHGTVLARAEEQLRRAKEAAEQERAHRRAMGEEVNENVLTQAELDALYEFDRAAGLDARLQRPRTKSNAPPPGPSAGVRWKHKWSYPARPNAARRRRRANSDPGREEHFQKHLSLLFEGQSKPLAQQQLETRPRRSSVSHDEEIDQSWQRDPVFYASLPAPPPAVAPPGSVGVRQRSTHSVHLAGGEEGQQPSHSKKGAGGLGKRPATTMGRVGTAVARFLRTASRQVGRMYTPKELGQETEMGQVHLESPPRAQVVDKYLTPVDAVPETLEEYEDRMEYEEELRQRRIAENQQKFLREYRRPGKLLLWLYRHMPKTMAWTIDYARTQAEVRRIGRTDFERDIQDPDPPPRPVPIIEPGGPLEAPTRPKLGGRQPYPVTAGQGSREEVKLRRRQIIQARGYPIHWFNEGEEPDSPFVEVRCSVPVMPEEENAITYSIRAFVITAILVTIGSGANAYWTYRAPAPTFSTPLFLVASYLLGKLFEKILPDIGFYAPDWLPFVGGRRHSLNPGPWSSKEQALCAQTSVVVFSDQFNFPLYFFETINSPLFWGISLGFGFEIMFFLSTTLIGLGLAGTLRRFLVQPASALWPQNLQLAAFAHLLFEDEDKTSGRMSRMRFFWILLAAVFVWQFAPTYLFQALSTFNFVSWIAPYNGPANYFFGYQNGMALLPITFDWTQILYLGINPLVAPWWVGANALAACVIFFGIIGAPMYFSNYLNFGYLPVHGFGGLYDKWAKPYNLTQPLDHLNFSQDLYDEYSPPLLTLQYYFGAFAGMAFTTAVLVHVYLHYRHHIWRGITTGRAEEDDIHSIRMRNYRDVPDRFYAVIVLLGIALMVVCIRCFGPGMFVGVLFLAIAFILIFAFPLSRIHSITGIAPSINIFAEMLCGYVLPGLPVPNMIFKATVIQSLTLVSIYSQSFKLGHYMKIPHWYSFAVPTLFAIYGAAVQIGVQVFLRAFVKDLCSPNQEARLICVGQSAFYSASLIWGTVGPTRLFNLPSAYSPVLWALIIGAVLPVPFYWLSRVKGYMWAKYINIPVVFMTVGFVYSIGSLGIMSFAALNVFTQYYLRKRFFSKWDRYNYLSAAGLDAGAVLNGLVVFLCIQLVNNGTIVVDWIGNSISDQNMDQDGTPWLSPPANSPIPGL